MLCTICNERPTFTKGRCQRCSTYYYRHGSERPACPTTRGVYASCINCGREQINGYGRCRACRQYVLRKGIERPKELWQRRIQEAELPRWCKNCGNPSIMGYMRCTSCYRYWYNHGKERPRKYFQDDPVCKTCGIPLDAVLRKKSGRCERCYEYLRRFKKERPDKLWGHGPHGWCECGNAAHHLIDKFPLCNDCAKEYRRPIESTGDTHINFRGSTRW